MVTSLIRPSYHQGFARSAGESAHPSLWRGKILHLPTFLGVTGNNIVDITSFKNHFVLSNMEATDWVIGQHGYALSYGGTDEYASLTVPPYLQPTQTITYSVWVRFPGSTNSPVFQNGSAFSRNSIRFDTDNSTQVKFNFSGTDINEFINAAGGGAFADNEEHHLCMVIDTTVSNGVIFYRDGIVGTVWDRIGETTSYSNTVLFLGARVAGSGSTPTEFGVITIGDFRVYDRALLQPEVLKLSKNPFADLQLRRLVFKAPVAIGINPKGVLGMPLSRPLAGVFGG